MPWPFGTPRSKSAKKTRVLVCNAGAETLEGFDVDAAVYEKHYEAVTTAIVRNGSELLLALEPGYEIVHLFSRCSNDGTLSDLDDRTLGGTKLIELCNRHQTKLLWIATPNPSQCYIDGFRAKGSPLNLIMTLDRKGERFTDFLDKLFSRISSGETLPQAWTALAPQKPGVQHSALPDCIVFAPGPPLSLPK